MNPFWLLPAGVLLVGGAVVVALLRNATEEARLLLEAMTHQREVADATRRLAGGVGAVTKSLPVTGRSVRARR